MFKYFLSAMLDIGLKYKIFLTLWATFVLTLIVSSLIYSSFINSERMHLIDGQIESYASLLARSTLITRDFAELDEAEEQIQEILGGYHLGLVLMIKNNRGGVLYKNVNAKRLGFTPSNEVEWQFTKHDGNLVRLYTKKIPEVQRTLQIGTFVNEQNLSAFFYTKNHITYFILLVIISAVLSYVLSTRLFSPMRRLAEDLNVITNQLSPSNFNSATWDTSFKKSKHYFAFKNDEFSTLITSVQNLLTQLQLAFEINRSHSARLAHEVNTPLSVIKNSVAQLKNVGNPEMLQQIHHDIDRLADFVHRYLEYSENLNTPQSKTDIYAIKLDKFADQIDRSLRTMSGDRICVEGSSDHTVFANHHDLEHLVLNLVTNALKYSPEDRNVILNFVENRITVSDMGSGIPEKVLDKMGTPFNIGENSEGQKGTGLGLAWVAAISKRYDWKLDINSTDHGTRVTVHL